MFQCPILGTPHQRIDRETKQHDDTPPAPIFWVGYKACTKYSVVCVLVDPE
jgi:hypothetical protein